MTISPINMRLGVCGVCDIKAAKYKCPKCKFGSCSLECVQVHKLENACDGIRNKTSFIPKDQIADLDVASDYRLLEATARCVDSYTRDDIKKSTRRFRDPHNIPLPPHLMKFRNACYRREKCRLHFLPQKFERHQQNTSRFNWKKSEIFWRVQLQFPHAVLPPYSKVMLDNISEKTILYELMRPYVEVKGIIKESDTSVTNDDLHIDKKGLDAYDMYKLAGFSGVKLLLKTEGDVNNSKKYYEMDISKSLLDNLSGKSIVEHPVLLLILNHHSDSFNLEDSSDDDTDIKDVNDKPSTCTKPNKNRIGSLTTWQPRSNELSPSLNDTLGSANPTANSTSVAVSHPEVSLRNMEDSPNLQTPPTNVAQHPITWKEAEFNKNCYDFYLKYYNEKYGITSNNAQVTSVAPPNQEKLRNVEKGPSTSKFYNANVIAPNINVPSGSSSPQSPVRQLQSESETAKPVSTELMGTVSKNSKETTNNQGTAIKTNGSSLQLLALYSDSDEEEMES